MAKTKTKINAAYRLSEIIASATSQSTNQSQFQVWVGVFRLQAMKSRAQKRMVMRGLDLIHEELDRIAEQVRAMEHPEDTSDELVSIVDSVITYELWGQSWSDLSQRLQRAVYPLRMLKNFLPDEERLIDKAEFDKVQADLSNLEKSIDEEDISPEVRAFVQRQINIIHKAFWEYRFSGIRAFEQAVFESVPDFVENQTVATNSDAPPMQGIRRICRKFSGSSRAPAKWETVLAASTTFTN